MNLDYLTIKWIHILSSVLMVGTGFGSAFYLYFANRTKNFQTIKDVSKLVVFADYLFTFPTVVIQPLSGYFLIKLGGFDPTSTWLLYSYVLFAIAGLSWLPVVWLQIKMAKIMSESNTQIPERYWTYARIWTSLGYIGFSSTIIIYWLMVNKPS